MEVQNCDMDQIFPLNMPTDERPDTDEGNHGERLGEVVTSTVEQTEENNVEVANVNEQVDYQKNGICPYVGMVFESPEDAYDFYNRYAGEVGFSVRKSSSSKSQRNGEVIARSFCCSLEGWQITNSKGGTTKSKIPSEKRLGCKARLCIKRGKGSEWMVSKVVEQHNHALTPPSERHKLRSQRKLCEGRSKSDGDEGDEDVNVEGGDVVVVNKKGKLSPRVGVEFESHEDAYNFYKRYASQMGFRVRKYSRRRSQRNGEIIGHSFCCSLEGWRVVSSMGGETRKKYRPETRLGCKAKMSIRKGKRGEWILSQIVEEHNHDLPTPSRRLKGRSQRKIIDGQRKVLDKIVTSRRNERERVNKEGNVANHNEPADEIVAVNKKGELCPCIGMKFESHEEAYSLYNRYAGRIGFVVRKCSTNKSLRNGEIIGRSFCCSLEGWRLQKSTGGQMKKKNRAETRLGCKAMMSIRKGKTGEWVVTKVVEQHNHALPALSKRHRGKSQIKTCDGQRNMHDNMCSAAVETDLMMNFMATEAGDTHTNGSTARYVRSYLNTKRQKELRKGDAEAVLDYLDCQQSEDPSFYYSVQVDAEGQLTNLFWADSRSKIDYHYFGDVVFFEPTYWTKRYGLPFIPIIGVNHHRQAVLFGCALLFDETEASFAWVLTAWMKAMHGKQPHIIFTSQDSAIEGAVAHVLPCTHHRYCLWHIAQTALENIPDGCTADINFFHDFNNCFYGSETVEEFESNWLNMLQKYGLRENLGLMRLHAKREKWASIYYRDIFSAFIYTALLNDSINSFFDGYLQKDMLLSDFVKQYEKAITARRKAEGDEDMETNQTWPIMKVFMVIEKEAAEVYTRSVFREFQEELVHSLVYCHEKVEENGTLSRYNTWKSGQEQAKHTVTFDLSFNNARCSCRLFEAAGLLCRHILKIFSLFDVQKLPTQYILKRWTRGAKCGTLVNGQTEEIRSDCYQPVTLRHNMLFREATNIAAKAAASEEVYRVALRCLHTTLEQVEAELKNASVSLPEQVGEVGHAHDVYISQGALEIHSDTGPLLDPLTMKQKGRPRKMYSFLDKQSKKKKINKTSQSVQISPAVLSDQISSVAQQDDLMSDFHQRNLISPYFLPAGVNHPYCPPPMNDLEFYPLSQRSNVINMQPSAVVLAGHQLQNLNQVSNVSTVQPSPFVMDGHQLHRFSHVSF